MSLYEVIVSGYDYFDEKEYIIFRELYETDNVEKLKKLYDYDCHLINKVMKLSSDETPRSVEKYLEIIGSNYLDKFTLLRGSIDDINCYVRKINVKKF